MRKGEWVAYWDQMVWWAFWDRRKKSVIFDFYRDLT
jgi:hypothetical protein